MTLPDHDLLNVQSRPDVDAIPPPAGLTPGLGRTLMFRFAAIVYLAVGFNYLWWRWTESINPDAYVFSITLYVAELLMFLVSILMIANYWSYRNIKPGKPVKRLGQIDPETTEEEDRPVRIDVLIATYNEPLAIVSETVRDALAMRYKHKEVNIRIYLCDDGQRDGRDTQKENFKAFAESLGVGYFVRPDNRGYKAGNLNHAFWQTNGDLVVILDADTRVFPDFLNNLTGYFRDPKMAWIQSPQWFYDLPQAVTLDYALRAGLARAGAVLSSLIPFSKSIKIGRDIFGTDPQIFYGVILYNRNAANAAFCCGAGSVHRRKALLTLVKGHRDVYQSYDSRVTLPALNASAPGCMDFPDGETIGPFVHHISEDIMTSILAHSYKHRWKSQQHSQAECMMLSPQTLPAYVKQFSRYAEGAFSIFFSKMNPMIKRGLSLRQRMAYADTMLSYFSPLWISVFLMSPIVFYFTLIPPLKAFNFDFFFRFLLLNMCIQVIMAIAHYPLDSRRSEQYYIAGFWIKAMAFFKVVLGKKLQFNTTVKEKQRVRFRDNLPHILPHLLIIVLTIAGFGYNLYLIFLNDHPSYSAFVANNIWAVYNMYQISPIIMGALKPS